MVFLCWAELFKMVCDKNETDVDISIPAVMLPQDAGVNMEEHIKNNSIGMIYLYIYGIGYAVLSALKILILKHFSYFWF